MLDTCAAAPALEALLAGDPPVLAFQPIVPLQRGANDRLWVEVLFRPTGASPEPVVRLAEGRGYGARLDLAILEASLAWVACSPHVARTCINVTSAGLRSPGFAAQVLDCLDAAAVAPNRICLEVSERDPLDASPRAEAALLELSAAGVGIAIDDFGIGCANLQLLTQLQPVALKVDLHLAQACLHPERKVRGPRVLSAVSAFAGALDIPLIVEGIETELQLQALRRLPALRSAYGQGYALGVPQLLHDLGGSL